MKKTLALILALALTLPLFACGGAALSEETGTAETLIHRTGEKETEGTSGVHDATGFCAGFGRADITPRLSVPLAGYGATSFRMSQNELDPLMVTCFAVRDEAGETLLIFQFDLIGISDSFGEQVRGMVSRATGVKEDYILLNATHTHAGPDVSSSEGSIGTWKAQAYKNTVQAARDAVADLDRCTVFAGAANTEKATFVRRYRLENGYSSPHGGIGSGMVVAHETEGDEEMRVVKFDRVNQPDLVMVNWQCHATMTGSSTKYDISADFPGAMRKEAEKDPDVKVLYLQGGAGNMAPSTSLPGEDVNGTTHTEKGKILVRTMNEALAGAVEVRTGAVRAKKSILTGTVNHEDDALLPICQQINALFNAGDRGGASAMAAANGLSSVYEARSIISRAGYGATKDFPLYCYAFGDVCITAAPFEMFSDTEKDLREASPFPVTLSCGYSNDSEGYMPAAECWPHRGYEVVQCRFVQGTAEEISARQLELLNEFRGR
ncbi:MAG: hypothetical protein II776_05515 [Clostridia bacterium]|nr:hypothetical protein [Clostridia bacterium]